MCVSVAAAGVERAELVQTAHHGLCLLGVGENSSTFVGARTSKPRTLRLERARLQESLLQVEDII